MSLLGKLASEDTTFTAEVGDLNVWAAQYLNVRINKSWLVHLIIALKEVIYQMILLG